MTGYQYYATELIVIAELLDSLNHNGMPEFGAMGGSLDIYYEDIKVGQILRDDEHGCWYYKAGGVDSDNP